jgi:hypothetical protein
MIQALAFVPQQDVIDGFVALKSHVDHKLLPLMDYFEKNYVGKLKRKTKYNPTPTERKLPLFPVTI